MKRIVLLVLIAVIALASPVFAVDVTLKWESGDARTQGYKVYQSVDGMVTWTLVADVGNVTAYTVTNIPVDKTVYFKTSAYMTVNGVQVETIRHWSGAWHDERLKPVNPSSGTGVQ